MSMLEGVFWILVLLVFLAFYRQHRAGSHRIDKKYWQSVKVQDRQGVVPVLAHLRINYQDADGRKTRRDISVMEFDGYSLHAYCHTRGDARTFLLTGISNPIDLETGSAVTDLPARLTPVRRLPADQAVPSIALLRIAYEDQRGRVTDRDISVIKFKKRDMIYAHCHMRKEGRHFYVDGILECADIESGEIISDIPAFFRHLYLVWKSVQVQRSKTPANIAL